MSPICRGFRYEVSLYVGIPIAWATLLKEASKHHYDRRCRETGDQGTVNGLYNCARLEQEARADDVPSTLPVTWTDLDLVTKVAEQLEHHTVDRGLIREIRTWLRESMNRIAAQRSRCMDLPIGSNEEVA